MNRDPIMTSKTIKSNKQIPSDRRRMLALMGAGVIVSHTLPKQWFVPAVNAVVLPAHAQTSMCTTDITVGGPLVGHPSGATSCQQACEAEAVEQDAQLCAVDEFIDGNSQTQCDCDLDLI